MGKQPLSKQPAVRPVAKSLREYARGIAGGLIFSLPLLYTMEMWWAGFVAEPHRLIVFVVVTFVLLIGYNRYAGLRRDASWTEVVIDSVEEMGLGIVTSFAILWMLGRITTEMAYSEVIGVMVVEAMVIAIGVSVGTAQLGGDEEEDTGMEGDGGAATRQMKSESEEPDFMAQLVLALCGAVLFASNVAPTEEILLIAIEAPMYRIIEIMFFSMIVSAGILFYTRFPGATRFVRQDGIATTLMGTCITYAIALGASAMALWFFGHFDGLDLAACLAQTVVLGVAASLGASAGRLLLQ